MVKEKIGDMEGDADDGNVDGEDIGVVLSYILYFPIFVVFVDCVRWWAVVGRAYFSFCPSNVTLNWG